MVEENWSMPTGEQMKEQQSGGDFSPLPADDYIVKVAKIILEKKPKWNNTTRTFNYNELELQYTTICLVYKLKAEDGLFYKDGTAAKPLTPRIWRGFNPFSIWAMKNGDPTFLRSFMAYAQWVSADLDVEIPSKGIVVLKTNDDFASEEDTKAYKTRLKQYLAKEITLEEFNAKKAGFKHIFDIRMLEGKYVWAKISLDEKGKNKITAFSKLPTTFAPDATIESEAMAKFADSFQKMLAKRNEKVDAAPSKVEVDWIF